MSVFGLLATCMSNSNSGACAMGIALWYSVIQCVCRLRFEDPDAGNMKTNVTWRRVVSFVGTIVSHIYQGKEATGSSNRWHLPSYKTLHHKRFQFSRNYMALLIMLGEFCKYSFAVTCVVLIPWQSNNCVLFLYTAGWNCELDVGYR